jgi:error-prone DNA polymerase
MKYFEFAVASNFSFLRGASHPEELMLQAQQTGLAGLGLCDRNSVAGVVRAHLTKREQNLSLRYHPGARLVFADATPDVLVYPRARAGWGRLCRLLTRGNLRAEKGDCILYFDDLLDHIDGLELIVMPGCTRDSAPEFLHKARASYLNEVSPCGESEEFRTRTGVALKAYETEDRTADDFLSRLAEAAPGRVRLAAIMLYQGRDRAQLAARAELARKAGLPLIAVNDVFYHRHERRELQDVLTCIRNHVTIDAAGRFVATNAERYLKSPEEMVRLFRDFPEAIAETGRLDATLAFSLDELSYEYPEETREGFATPQDALVHFAWEGAAKRYPNGIPEKISGALDHELRLIAELRYAPYFLTVHDIVRFAKSKGILCQGRGSAANSAVCFCLGVTEVDPDRIDLLFERFISANRREPPDIDVDFEHERREEVIQYIYERYGRHRAGIGATVISYRGRSAIREIGKAFGLSEDTIGALSSWIWGMGGGSVREGDLARVGLDLTSPRMQKLRVLVKEIQSFPRHLSQHVGGFVITRGRIDEVVPLMNGGMDKRTHVEWDKDDLDALRILKVDVLGLGMLTCIEKSLRLLAQHYGEKYTIASIPAEEEAVYRMLCRADSLGVFQVESRAQMTMLPRLKPNEFYDLVIEVAIVRPGPIQGNMVHPYLRRRQGIEKVSFPSKELEEVLSKTMGVPLFQEQAMKIAIVAGGFTPEEADRLRRAMATFRRVGTIGTFREKLIEGMVARKYEREFAERCFSQIEGFGEYGFPESHAASFAILVYVSAWLKCRYPDVFAAGLLNSQPLGFYATSQIVRDAREHGVEVRPVDVNFSNYDATLEPGPRAAERLHPLHREMRDDIRTTHALRLGLREIKGFSEDDAKLIEQHRRGGYDSVRDLWLRTGLDPSTLMRLAEADAFGSLGLSRRDALWACQALRRAGDKDDLPLFALAEPAPPMCEPDVALPPMPLGQEVVEDYRMLRLSLRRHPVEFVRHELDRARVIKNEALRIHPNGKWATVAGLVLIRQRPGSANGVIFLTLEDESAVANVIVWPDKFERYRPEVLGGRLLLVRGPVQNEQNVIHLVADEIIDATGLLAHLGEGPAPETLSRADHVKHGDERLDIRARGLRRKHFMEEVAENMEHAADLVQAAPGSAHKPARRGKVRAAHPPALDFDAGALAKGTKFPLTPAAPKRF